MHLLTADSAITELIILAMGGSGFPVTLALFLWWLYGWYSTGKDAAEKSMRAAHLASKTVGALRARTAGDRRMIAAGVILMLIAQVSWLISSYIVGNIISVMFLVNKKINQSPGASPPTFGQAVHALQFDAVSGTYTAIAVLGVIISYRAALNSTDGSGAEGIGCLLGLPGYATAGFGVLFFVLDLFLMMTHAPGYTAKAIVTSLLAAVAGIVYAASCILVMRMPVRLSRWRAAPGYYRRTQITRNS
jgi:hypothetical protein